MSHDAFVPPHLAALFEQITATEARIAVLDRELAAIRAGRLSDNVERHTTDLALDDALAGEDTLLVAPARVVAPPDEEPPVVVATPSPRMQRNREPRPLAHRDYPRKARHRHHH